eukprot:m.39483 g.39483  ORF g.39483 m.39483 type:complete len:412 (+) comp9560_c0_seq1:146-1381(+)
MDFTIISPTEEKRRSGDKKYRAGVFSHGNHQGKRKLVHTPTYALFTRSGHVPHLMPDLLSQIPNFDIVLASLRDTLSSPGTATLKKYDGNTHKFFGLPDNITTILSAFDSELIYPDGLNGEEDVSISSTSGRTKLTVSNFINFVEAYAPDVVISLADIQSAAVSEKRQRKAVDRTLAYLDHICASSLAKPGIDAEGSTGTQPYTGIFGSIVGGRSTNLRRQCTKEVISRSLTHTLDGFALCGFNMGESQEERASLISMICNELPENKIRLLQGCMGPLEILEQVELGVDLFDGLYPFLTAEEGYATTFSFGSWRLGSDTAASKELKISLWDGNMESFFGPLLPGCPCVACTKYTCAYIHHLLHAHEMLAFVLLAHHNVVHFSTFFDEIRKSIQSDRLRENIEIFKKEYYMI